MKKFAYDLEAELIWVVWAERQFKRCGGKEGKAFVVLGKKDLIRNILPCLMLGSEDSFKNHNQF